MGYLISTGPGAFFLDMARALKISSSKSSKSISQAGGLEKVVWIVWTEHCGFGVIGVESNCLICRVTSCRKVSSKS